MEGEARNGLGTAPFQAGPSPHQMEMGTGTYVGTLMGQGRQGSGEENRMARETCSSSRFLYRGSEH